MREGRPSASAVAAGEPNLISSLIRTSRSASLSLFDDRRNVLITLLHCIWIHGVEHAVLDTGGKERE